MEPSMSLRSIDSPGLSEHQRSARLPEAGGTEGIKTEEEQQQAQQQLKERGGGESNGSSSRLSSGLLKARTGLVAISREWERKNSTYLMLQRAVLEVVRLLIVFLSVTHFLRTSWTVQNMFQSGAEYDEQWSVYSAKIQREQDDGLNNHALAYRLEGPDMDDISDRMKQIHASQLLTNARGESSRAVKSVFMHSLSIEHTKGNDRCKKMKGNYLVETEDWERVWLTYLVEETMLLQAGSVSFWEIEEARDKSKDVFDYLARGYWPSRRSLDVRTLSGLGSIPSLFPDGMPDNATDVEVTLPGNRFNLKSTCIGCEEGIVVFRYFCDVKMDILKVGPAQVQIHVKESAPSATEGLNELSMGLSFVWTWKMSAGDAFRLVAQIISLYYAVGIRAFGLVSAYMLAKAKASKKAAAANDDDGLSLSGILDRLTGAMQYLNIMPARIGFAKEGTPPYFFQHNSWPIIFCNVAALAADSLITIAYIRETNNYAMWSPQIMPKYWMMVYGLRFMWVYLFIFKALKRMCLRLDYRWANRCLTCVCYIYMPATLVAVFTAERFALAIVGDEMEFEGLPSMADSLSISFVGSFFFVRCLPYFLSLFAWAFLILVINFLMNSYWLRYRNTLDRAIIEHSSIVCGSTGLASTRVHPKMQRFHYVSDAGTMLQVAWLLHVSGAMGKNWHARRPSMFSRAQISAAVSSSLVGGAGASKTDRRASQFAGTRRDSLLKIKASGDAVLNITDDETLLVELTEWHGFCTLVATGNAGEPLVLIKEAAPLFDRDNERLVHLR